MKKIYSIVLMLSMWVGTVSGTTAAKGVFSVSATKKVQFADAPESGLVQWSAAVAMQDANWQLLTGDEWSYLLASGRTDASDLNSLGTINGENVLIILPDGWVKPDGVPDFSTAYMSEGFGANTYDSDTWALMAASGAVYLPCGGYSENGSDVINPTDHGRYWAADADEYDSSKGHTMAFHNGYIHDLNSSDKALYYSVILVRDVPVYLDENDDKDKFYTHWTAAKGKDYAYVRRTLAKDSTLYTLCLPFDVPDIDESPLAGAEVFAFTGGDVSGTTGNERLHLHMKRLEGKRLTQGVPYLLRWMSPGGALSQPLYFEHVENWDADTTTATHPGNDKIKCRGVYPKTHIPGYTSGSVAHYNFFIGANNTLYWPDETTYGSSDMRGFRGYFYITPGGYPAGSPIRRGMQAVWEIDENAPTGIGQCTMDKGQCTKVFKEGQVILVIDGKEYDLQGKVIQN